MALFLHEKGYTYFSIPDLIYPEINNLVDAANRRAKKQERDNKRMSRKSKNKGRRYR